MLSSKESFDWELNTVTTERNYSKSDKEHNRSKVINKYMFKSEIFLNKESVPDPRFVFFIF